MTIHRSVCPYDCPDTCGLLVEVQDGRAVRVTGDPDHPITRGLLCPKMSHYERTVHSPLRLTTPLLRTGAKGSGEFAPISWDEAIEHICSRWKGLIAEHGGESILPYSYAGTMGLVQRNSGHPFFHRLGASRLERTICSPAKDAGWKAVMGETPAMDPAEMEGSDLVILWGINAVATSIHAMRDAGEARKRGARVWAVDTYHTPTCDAVRRGLHRQAGRRRRPGAGDDACHRSGGAGRPGVHRRQCARVSMNSSSRSCRNARRSGCRRFADCRSGPSSAWRGSMPRQRRLSSDWGAA